MPDTLDKLKQLAHESNAAFRNIRPSELLALIPLLEAERARLLIAADAAARFLRLVDNDHHEAECAGFHAELLEVALRAAKGKSDADVPDERARLLEDAAGECEGAQRPNEHEWNKELVRIADRIRAAKGGSK